MFETLLSQINERYACIIYCMVLCLYCCSPLLCSHQCMYVLVLLSEVIRITFLCFHKYMHVAQEYIQYLSYNVIQLSIFGNFLCLVASCLVLWHICRGTGHLNVVCCVGTATRQKAGNMFVHTVPNASPSRHPRHITGTYKIENSGICAKSDININPLPSLMLQSARDLNVPCWHKRSKSLLL
jgi:hypothetical protein